MNGWRVVGWLVMVGDLWFFLQLQTSLRLPVNHSSFCGQVSGIYYENHSLWHDVQSGSSELQWYTGGEWLVADLSRFFSVDQASLEWQRLRAYLLSCSVSSTEDLTMRIVNFCGG